MSVKRRKHALKDNCLMEAQGKGLAFTGERYVPSEQGEIRLEHFHRYGIALDIVANKDVLDIASGEGYGSFLLATVAHSVTGIDISQEAVRHAHATYGERSNLTFLQGSATKINLPDHTFDVVISFETIEHLAEQSMMLSEIRRVLKPSGVLLISSPNRPIYSEAAGTHNEFHVKELDFNEFNLLLREQFDAIHYLGQRLLIGSIVQPLEGVGSSLRTLRDDGVNVQESAGPLSEPVYFLALCAATEVVIPTIDASLMQPDKLDLLKQYIGYAKWAIGSNRELESLRKLHTDLNEEHHKVASWAQSLDKQNSTLSQTLLEREQQIASLSDETVKRGEWALGLEAQLKTTQAELSRLVTERESYVVRLAQVGKELNEIRDRYVGLHQEHHKVGTWAHSLDKQLTETTLVLSEREKQIAALSDDVAKQRESASALEAQLKSTETELSQAIAERDHRIEHINGSVAKLNDQIAKLDRDVLRAEYELRLQEQGHLKELEQKTLGFEHEKTLLFIAQSEKEEKLGKEHADRERVLQERLIALQVELRRADQERTEKAANQSRLVAQERSDLQAKIADMYRQIQDLGREKVKRAEAQSEKERKLINEHAQRERTLHERLNAMQAALRQADQQWIEECRALEDLAVRERADLNAQIILLQQQIQELNREKAQLLASHSEQEIVLSRESAERERVLYERFLAAQNEFNRLEHEWAEKAAIQQSGLADHQQRSAILQAQLQHQIDAAKQLATQWELARNALQFELDSIKSTWVWRFIAQLPNLGLWNSLAKEHASPYRPFDSVNANSTEIPMADHHQGKIDQHFEDVGMTNNSVAQAVFPNGSMTSLDDLLDYHDEAFVHAAYHTLLRRAPDSEGLLYYVRRLRRGVDKLQVLDQISRSNEAKVRAVKLAGLEDALRRNRWQRLPVIGALLNKMGSSQNLHALENQLFRLNELNGRRFTQIEKAITSLSQMIVLQAQTVAGSAAIQRLGYVSVDCWQAVETLLSFEGKQFLDSLFQLALLRFPEVHETDHYLRMLDEGVSKLHIIESVFSCTECRTRLDPELQISALVDRENTQLVVANGMPDQLRTSITDSIRFLDYENPLVSIVIPVFGKIEYTLMCLKSIQKNLPKVEFEIIIVDDKSPDNTVAELSKVRGIKLVENSTNLGFIRSCNHGAERARGEYLCFLNNDTEVSKGWLDELVRTFHEFPGTGLAGSKFVYPNGTLQEAGGILWRDGSAWNFGRNQDPSLPVFNYAREVDYCSGASIMLPHDLFNELGGFDEHYLPAYCEDSDLALKVRDRGYRVIYQPLSVVVHYEGITSGTDTTQGIKAYQIENSRKLIERWSERLSHYQVNGVDVDKAKDRVANKRVLVLDHCTPTPDQDAGSVTVFNLLLLLREMGFQITFIPEDNFLYMPEYTTRLQRIGVEVLYAPYFTSVEQHLAESGARYDLAFIFRPGVMEKHLITVRKNCPKAKLLYHTVDLHFLRMMREADLLSDSDKQKLAEEMKQREFEMIRKADASIVHSTAELEILRKDLRKEKIHVFPLIMDVCGTSKQFHERNDIVFVGGYQHTPNIDAVQYFVKEIMPLLRVKLPDVRFFAVGSKPPEEILDLACEDVVITGFVEELNPFLDRMRVAVAPLRYGAGIKGKIGSAMAVGLPTVATTLAAEGMSLKQGENIIIADSPEDFVCGISDLFLDERHWNEISKCGLQFAENNWGAEAAWKTLSSIVSDLDIKPIRSKYPLSLYSPPVFPNSAKQTASQSFGALSLEPVAIVKTKAEFSMAFSLDVFNSVGRFEDELIRNSTNEHFLLDGLCIPCSKKVQFIVDMLSGGKRENNTWTPNWRERLECPSCHMNNRQRLIATLVKQRLDTRQQSGAKIYFMEQVTSIFKWAGESFPQHRMIGSEYLGHQYSSGDVINGVLHQDVTNLSFGDDSIDLIVSNDVFEHVPDFVQAFGECARVLRKGGVLYSTFPFHWNSDESVVRAKLTEDGHVDYLPPIYHGNPVSNDGSLVFTDFGWDVIEAFQKVGFGEARVLIFASTELGHLGRGNIVFEAIK